MRGQCQQGPTPEFECKWAKISPEMCENMVTKKCFTAAAMTAL